MSSTNIQEPTIISLERPFSQIRLRKDGAINDNALLIAISVNAIQPTYADMNAQIAVHLHHISPNIHFSPKYSVE